LKCSFCYVLFTFDLGLGDESAVTFSKYINYFFLQYIVWYSLVDLCEEGYMFRGGERSEGQLSVYDAQQRSLNITVNDNCD